MPFNIKTKTFHKGSGRPQAGPSRTDDDRKKFADPRRFFNSQTGSKPSQADSAVACKVLQMQWNERMRQSQMEPSRTLLPDKNKSNEQKEGKRIPWSNRTGSSGSLDETNRTIDPWFVDDVWGDDLPPEALEECSKIEMTQRLVSERPGQVDKPSGSRSALENAASSQLKDLVWDNWNATDITPESNRVPDIKNIAPSSSGTQKLPPANLHSQSKEFPNQNSKLSASQRFLQKPTKSLPSPVASDSRAKTTEWLRSELKKKNEEVNSLKLNINTKNGENKVLREILKSTQQELSKIKENRRKEEEMVKNKYELMEKELKKQLGAIQTHAQFKEKELEAYKEKCLEMKKFGSKEAHANHPVEESFKKFNQSFVRPGEVSTRNPVSDTISETLHVTPSRIPESDLSCDIFDLEGDWDLLKSNLESTWESDCSLEGPSSSQACFPCRPSQSCHFQDNGRKLASGVQTIIDGPKPKSEINHFLQPPVEYLSENLLFTEFSELPMENYPFRRPTLIDIWGISYHAFGQTRLDEYEKTKIGDPVKPDEARAVLAKKRFFTTLEEERQSLDRLCRSTVWGQESFDCAVKIVECVTEMAREVYASLGDPRYLRASYTINEREPRILKDLTEGSELNETFDPLSHKPWKDECCVELRRGLVLIGILCSLDANITRYVFNPKQKSSTTGRQHLVTMPNSDRMSLAIAETHGHGEGERTLNQSISSFIDSSGEGEETVFNSLSGKLALLKTKEASKSLVVSQPSLDSEEVRFECSSIEELERERRSLIESNKWTHNWERSYVREKIKMTNEDRAVVGETESVEPLFEEMMTQKVNQPSDGNSSLNADRPNVHDAFVKQIKNKSKLHRVNFAQSTRKKLTCEEIVLMPTSQFVSPVEERLLVKSKDHMQRTARIVKSRNEIEVPQSIDFTALYSLGDQKEKDEDLFATQRKKKNEKEISSKEEDKGCEATQRLDLKRSIEEASLSREGASEEKRSRLESDTNVCYLEEIPAPKIVLSKKHSLGPLSGRSKPTEKMEIDVFDEVEKLYASQAVDGVKENLDSSRAPEIEHIPEILEKFKSKISKAGLLELMCEVIKQGGLLRYTHRLNGTILGQVIMLQYIVKSKKMEAQKNMSKIFGILREVMYSRPSPVVVYEVHKLVNMGVTIPGFTRMLCHNSDPDKFVVNESAAYYQRGACLLEMLCILTDMLDEEANWKSAYEMSKWLHCVLTTDQLTVASWYPNGESNVGRQCSCTVALANCAVIIFYRAALFLRHSVQLDSLSLTKKSQLAEMIRLGIASLSALQTLDHRFFKKIYSRRDMFKKFSDHVRYLNESPLHHKYFSLSETCLNQFKGLLANFPHESQARRETDRPDFSDACGSNLADVELRNLFRRTRIEDD